MLPPDRAMSTDRTSPVEDFVPTDAAAIAERLAVGWRTVVFCAIVGLTFVYFDNLPIYHSDIWGHVSYGDWIREHGELPVEEPLLDLAEGVPMVASAWLSQVVFSAVNEWGGAAWVSHLFGLAMTAVLVLFALGLWHRTGSPMWGLLGAFAVFAIGPTRIAVVRPETFGTLLFAGLLLICTLADDGPGRRGWVSTFLIAALMALWANLHGSYVVGIAVIGARGLGRFLEAWGQSTVTARTSGDPHPLRSGLAGAIRDEEFRYWLVVTELSVLATFLNPYGVDLLVNAFTFPSNPNLVDVLEWKPLPLISVEGITFAASWIALVFVARFSRRSFRVHEIVILAVLNLAVIKGVRMISWYAAVYVFALAPHVRDVFDRAWTWYREVWARSPETPSTVVRTTEEDEGRSLGELVLGRSIIHTATACLFLWWGFAFSPMGNVLLGGDPRTEDRLYHEWTPREVVGYLREHPPTGRVFNPQWWGDWLVRELPEQQFFMTTNAVHVAPRKVWNDYLRVARAANGWSEVLLRYNVSTVVVHEEGQVGLAERLRSDQGWKVVYEDDLATVFERTGPSNDAEAERETSEKKS